MTLLLLFQNQQPARLIERTDPLSFHELYTIVVNWVMLNGPRIVIAIVVFIIGQWILRLFRGWIQKLMYRKDVHSSAKPFIESLINVAIQILLFVFVMQIMGVELTLFAAGIASLGVALGLALSGTLQNFACGLLILFLKPFKVGDRIFAQGQDGIVQSIQVFYTIVNTTDNRTVIFPNSKLSNEVIIKFPEAKA